jgi:hypothetical protein
MFDDGTHGDLKAGDHIWSLELDFPVGTVLQYKFTNSGPHGQWIPGEEFAGDNRSVTLDGKEKRIVLLNVFGKK